MRTVWVRSLLGSKLAKPGHESTTAFSLNMSAVVAERPLNKRMRSKTTPSPQEALPQALVLDPEALDHVCGTARVHVVCVCMGCTGMPPCSVIAQTELNLLSAPQRKLSLITFQIHDRVEYLRHW